MMATRSSQVPVIIAAFEPDADEVAWARRVVHAFADAAAMSLDGRMLSTPHRRQTECILEGRCGTP